MIHNPSFARFVEATYPALLGFLRRRVGNAAAEDIAQSAYVSALQHPGFDPDQPGAAAFVRKKARWLALDHRRRATRAPERLPEDLPHRSPGEQELALETAELRARVAGAVAALPGTYREILLRHLRGMDHREIAADLALPVRTVYQRFHQAKAALRESLSPDAPLPCR